MSPNQDLFMDFPAVSKADWLAKITKDLKGRDISELTWLLPDLEVPPFAHADDLPDAPMPLAGASNAWQVGADVVVTHKDWAAANALALEALMGGANAPRFVVEDYPDATEMAVLLKDIELDYIEWHLVATAPSGSPLSFLQNIYEWAQKQGKNTDILRGVVYFDPLATPLSPESLRALSTWTEKHLPAVHYNCVGNPGLSAQSEQVVADLTALTEYTHKQWTVWAEAGVDTAIIAPKTTVALGIGTAYFVEIAKLRALKLVWAHLLEGFGLPVAWPTVQAFVGPETQVADPHTNKIRQTTQAMSAVIAGISTLFIAPSDALEQVQGSRQSRRIARNVQHLLQMESYLDKVSDAAAGSYYLETLTEKIAQTVWEKANFTA